MIPRRFLGREVGVVLSGATAVAAPIAVRRDMENVVREDLIVAVEDSTLGDNKLLLGVLRFVTRYEPFLRRGLPNVYTAYPQALTIDMLSPFTNAYVEFYGVVEFEDSEPPRGRLEPPYYAPQPGSRVYLVSGPELLDSIIGFEGVKVGRHPFTGWQPPLDPEALKMHVGVFGATGTGKSRLVRRLVREAARYYSIIVFDHTGVDYAPAAKKMGYTVIDGSRVRLDPITMAEMLAEIMDLPNNLWDYLLVAVYCHDAMVRGEYPTLHACISAVSGNPGRQTSYVSRAGSRQQRSWSREEFTRTLIEAARILGAKNHTLIKLSLYAARVPDYVYRRLGSRDMDAKTIVDLALENRVVVVDLSTEEEIAAKRAVITQVVDEIWSRIHETGRPVNIGIVVDEAQNYACEYCRPSAQRLEKVAREGRKWGFWLVVASQRVSRDIRPGVRANLGTVFFSKLQALTDLQELSGYLDLGNVTNASLAMLARREFYVAGFANPLRKPILVKVDHVPDDGF